MTTTHTLQHRHPSVKNATLALAGAALALGGAYGITVLAAEDGAVTAPGQEQRPAIDPSTVRDPSLERLMPAVPGTEQGVRDSWMSPGLTDQKLDQLR